MADNFLTRYIKGKRKDSAIGGDNRAKKIEDAEVRESNETQEYRDAQTRKKEADAMKKGFKKGGSIDGCAIRGKTKGRMV